MGTYWSVLFGTDVQPKELEAVLRHMGGRRADYHWDEIMQETVVERLGYPVQSVVSISIDQWRWG